MCHRAPKLLASVSVLALLMYYRVGLSEDKLPKGKLIHFGRRERILEISFVKNIFIYTFAMQSR